jgi:hypothetical protein
MMELALTIGLVFSLLAALAAFAISYAEYSRHYTDKRRPLLLSLQTALFVFVVFMALSAGIGLVLPRLSGAKP